MCTSFTPEGTTKECVSEGSTVRFVCSCSEVILADAVPELLLRQRREVHALMCRDQAPVFRRSCGDNGDPQAPHRLSQNCYGIRENPQEKPKTREREQSPDSNFFLRVGGQGVKKWLLKQSLKQTVAHCPAKLQGSYLKSYESKDRYRDVCMCSSN